MNSHQKLLRGGLTYLFVAAAVLGLRLCAASAWAQSADGTNYYSAQFPDRPPLPANMLALPVVPITAHDVLVDDLSVNYEQLGQQNAFFNALESAMDDGPPLPGEGQPGEGGTNWVDSSTARTFVGSCTGRLLTPAYQGTNLVLSLTGTTSGDKYDLYSVTNLTVTNWTYLGRWTNLTSSWITWDNFGRAGGSAQFSSGLGTLANLHVYNPMAKTGEWSAAFNSGTRHSESRGGPSFPPTKGYLGRGANSGPLEFLNGELAEVMVFDRELSQAERDAIKTNCLNKRFNLW